GSTLGQQVSDYGQQTGARIADDALAQANYVKSGGAAYGKEFGALADRALTAGDAFAQRTTPGYDPSQQTGALQTSQQRAADLAGLEATEGPSAAQAQLQMGLNQAQQSNLALARSGSGFGESAQNFSQAIDANARMGQDAANQAAMLRAQENAQWRQRQAQNIGAAAGIDQSAAGQYGQQSQFRTTTEQQQQQQNAADYLAALTLGGQFRGQGATAELGAQQAGAQLQQAGLLAGGQLGLTGTQGGMDLYSALLGR